MGVHHQEIHLMELQEQQTKDMLVVTVRVPVLVIQQVVEVEPEMLEAMVQVLIHLVTEDLV